MGSTWVKYGILGTEGCAKVQDNFSAEWMAVNDDGSSMKFELKHPFLCSNVTF